jgi:hypothetical protein
MNRAVKISGLVLLILISIGLTLWFGIQPPHYTPDYTVSAPKGRQPALISRSPWRTLIVYKVAGAPHQIGPKIVAEVQKQRPNWKLSRLQGMYQLEDPKITDYTQREGIQVIAGTSANVTYVQIVSPLYRPTFLQKWWHNLRTPE